jgi:hypothetical protein
MLLLALAGDSGPRTLDPAPFKKPEPEFGACGGRTQRSQGQARVSGCVLVGCSSGDDSVGGSGCGGAQPPKLGDFTI